MKSAFWIKLLLCVMAAAVVGYISIAAMHSAGQQASTKTIFEQFVVSGGFIVWFIQIPLSVITLYLIIEHFLTIRRKKLIPADIARELVTAIRQFGFQQFTARATGRKDMVSLAVRQALSHEPVDIAELHNKIAASLEEQATRLLRKIEWHNVIGNISPMIGLFGTVLGMIEIFNQMGISGGQAQHSQLAHGISVAWVTTFWGLLTAIPALAVHGVLRNRVETFASEAAEAAEAVAAELKRQGRHQEKMAIENVKA